MLAKSVLFTNEGCFKHTRSGLEEFKPLTIIIGKNNSGKSHLLDFIEFLCGGDLESDDYNLFYSGTFSQEFLDSAFAGKVESRFLPIFKGVLINQDVSWQNDNGNCLAFFDRTRYDELLKYQVPSKLINHSIWCIENQLRNISSPYSGKSFTRLSADRDIQPEPSDEVLELHRNGQGATNIIRRYITSSSFDESLIEEKLLEALNEIFGEDGRFTEIRVQNHDESVSLDGLNATSLWQIYLREKHKGLVSLSNSGSGIKTILLVLLQLLVIPELQKVYCDNFVFAFEELENNLHPSLQRRLMDYIQEFSKRKGAKFVLTTHSNVILDYFCNNTNAQVVHVSHDGRSASTKTISTYFDRIGVVSELGAKPSDLLQANGVIWVEGPSDRFYLNRWIEIFSNREFKEGHNYQIAFYGGSLLANIEFEAPEVADDEFANLLQLNPNVAVICDSDRTGEADELKERVARIKNQVGKVPNAFSWVLGVKEIENYLTAESMEGFSAKKNPSRNPDQFEQFFPNKSNESSFLEEELGRKSVNKTELAMYAALRMDEKQMANRFDLKEKVLDLVETIRNWNS